MQQTSKSMFERAYRSHLEDRGQKPQRVSSKPASNKQNGDLPLFYIALMMAVVLYVGLLVVAPSKVKMEDWFPTIMNPNSHVGMTETGNHG